MILYLLFFIHEQGKRDWSVKEYHGAWIKGRTAGGCGNTNRGKYMYTTLLIRTKNGHCKRSPLTENIQANNQPIILQT